MNKAIITALLVLVTITGQAQEIRTNEPTLDDYLQLLSAKGYIAYSFDMKDFKGKQYEPVIMEYVKGEEAKDYIGFSFSFPIGEKLVIGFAPSSNDSTYVYSFQSVGGGGFNATLKLQPVFAPEMPMKQAYRYESRPFELVSPIELESSSRSSCLVPIGMRRKLALVASVVKSRLILTSRQTSSNQFPTITCLVLKSFSL